MQSAGAAVDKLLHERGKRSTSGPFSAETADLLFGWDFTSKEEPEETFGKRLVASWSLGKGLLDVGDGVATEADTLLSIENRA